MSQGPVFAGAFDMTLSASNFSFDLGSSFFGIGFSTLKPVTQRVADVAASTCNE
jgi:hypothetical protein